jgi:hypothetical protein
MADDDTTYVYPSTSLAAGEYLPGVGEDGGEVPTELAREWLDSGLARLTKPRRREKASIEPQPDGMASGEQAPIDDPVHDANDPDPTSTIPEATPPADPAKE